MKYLLALALVATLGAGCAGQQTLPPVSPAPSIAPQPAKQPAPPSLQPTAKPQDKPGHSTFGVSITDTTFVPQVQAVYVGDTIVWTNNGKLDHNVGATDVAVLWDSGNLKPGESFSHTFTAAGTYTVRSTGKNGFQATVIVREIPKK